MGFPKGRSGSSPIGRTRGFKPRVRYNLISYRHLDNKDVESLARRGEFPVKPLKRLFEVARAFA